jgi:hypothetical protein
VFVLVRVLLALSPALSETYYDEALTGWTTTTWVFLHVVGLPGGGNHDKPVGALQYGPSRWTRGERVRQTISFTVPPDTPPGVYPLRVGVWLPSTGRRLRILAADLPQTRRTVDLGGLVIGP